MLCWTIYIYNLPKHIFIRSNFHTSYIGGYYNVNFLFPRTTVNTYQQTGTSGKIILIYNTYSIHILYTYAMYTCAQFYVHMSFVTMFGDNFPSEYSRRVFENNDLKKKLITSTRLNYWILFFGALYIVDCSPSQED